MSTIDPVKIEIIKKGIGFFSVSALEISIGNFHEHPTEFLLYMRRRRRENASLFTYLKHKCVINALDGSIPGGVVYVTRLNASSQAKKCMREVESTCRFCVFTDNPKLQHV